MPWLPQSSHQPLPTSLKRSKATVHCCCRQHELIRLPGGWDDPWSMVISGSNTWRYVLKYHIFGDMKKKMRFSLKGLGLKHRPNIYGRYLRPQSVPESWPLTWDVLPSGIYPQLATFNREHDDFLRWIEWGKPPGTVQTNPSWWYPPAI